MTTEFALLLAIVGLGLIGLGRFQHDRGFDDDAGVLIARPPSWLTALARHGPGPLRAVSVGFEVWGVGTTLLGLLVVVAGSRATLLTQWLALWFLGGVLVIEAADFVVSTRRWLRRRSRRGSR